MSEAPNLRLEYKKYFLDLCIKHNVLVPKGVPNPRIPGSWVNLHKEYCQSEWGQMVPKSKEQLMKKLENVKATSRKRRTTFQIFETSYEEYLPKDSDSANNDLDIRRELQRREEKFRKTYSKKFINSDTNDVSSSGSRCVGDDETTESHIRIKDDPETANESYVAMKHDPSGDTEYSEKDYLDDADASLLATENAEDPTDKEPYTNHPEDRALKVLKQRYPSHPRFEIRDPNSTERDDAPPAKRRKERILETDPAVGSSERTGSDRNSESTVSLDHGDVERLLAEKRLQLLTAQVEEAEEKVRQEKIRTKMLNIELMKAKLNFGNQFGEM